MPMQQEFRKYGNEAAFIRDFVVPLLRRLGFFVVDYHGSREYGRDLIFSEIDRFNIFVYHGLQGKYQESISQQESGGLIDDCREAFLTPFQHPDTGGKSTFPVLSWRTREASAQMRPKSFSLTQSIGNTVDMFVY